MKRAGIIAFLICACPIAAAQEQPRPDSRPKPAPAASRPTVPVAVPQEFAPPQEAYASQPDAPESAAAPPPPSACQVRLAKIAAFRPLPMLVGPGECGAVDAVLLQTVTLADQTKIPLTPPATLRCPMAEAVAHWIREDIAPTVVKIGAPLRGVDNYDSYECRGRNRVRGATLSEHGRANALDVRGFRLASGQTVGLTDVKVAKDWREGVRASACARFSTVLGPGSDGAHEEHIHLDLAERRNNYKVCEWAVREPAPPPAEETAAQADETGSTPDETIPLPRPRPVEANKASGRKGGT